MTFQELITTNPTINLLNNEVNIYKALDGNIIDDNLITAIDSKLQLILKPLHNFELLYNEQVSLAILQKIVSENFLSLYTRLINFKQRLDKRWMDLDNYNDSIETESLNKEGYTGFNVTNQDGDYRQLKNSGVVTTQDKIKYLQFFNQDVEFWGRVIYDEIVNTILVTIY